MLQLCKMYSRRAANVSQHAPNTKTLSVSSTQKQVQFYVALEVQGLNLIVNEIIIGKTKIP